MDNWIISGGEKINPKEIEDSLHASGYVESAMVLGKDSKDWGQALIAILVSQGELSQQTVIDKLNEYLKHTLANYKLPKAYRFVDELPILENGKKDTVQIKELLDSIRV
jgi:acyl-CoA synthetase (AMP-forming)/AMP-acid ligase II